MFTAASMKRIKGIETYLVSKSKTYLGRINSNCYTFIFTVSIYLLTNVFLTISRIISTFFSWNEVQCEFYIKFKYSETYVHMLGNCKFLFYDNVKSFGYMVTWLYRGDIFIYIYLHFF